MKLLSATVRNYRIHQDKTVKFRGEHKDEYKDEYRVVFGGDNESGKSTFVEALHRCLFLKAKTTGVLRENMLSYTTTGNPEVELKFEAGGKEYHLKKVFGGQSGITKLAEASGRTWNQEEAEEELSRLLGIPAQCGGKSAASQLPLQWAHLWVWQGKSGDDPAGDANRERERLMHNLQTAGGAMVAQSDLDATLAAGFAARCDELFKKGDKAGPKAGTDWAAAQKEADEAEQNLKRISESYNGLIQAARDYETALEKIIHCDTALTELEKDQKSFSEQFAQAEKLATEAQRQSEDLQRAEKALADLKKADEEIRTCRKSIQSLASDLEPKREKLRIAQEHLTICKTSLDKAEQDETDATGAADIQRRKVELARNWLEHFKLEQAYQDLRQTKEKVDDHRTERDKLVQELAQLPNVTEDGIRELRQAQKAVHTAQTALDSMAAEIKVIRADQPVLVGDRTLEANSSLKATEVLEVKIGDGVVLSIRPGGGDRLAECRKELQKETQTLQRLLSDHGLASCDDAENTLQQRKRLQVEIETRTQLISSLDNGTLDERLQNAHADLTENQTGLEAGKKEFSDVTAPAEQNEAFAWLKSEQEKAKKTQEQAQITRQARTQKLELRKNAEKALEALQSETEHAEDALKDANSKLTLMLSQSGEDEKRLHALTDAERTKVGLEQQLFRTKKELQDLNPEYLQKELERLGRAIGKQNEARQDARDKKTESHTKLALSGTDDPKAELEKANVRLEAAQGRLQGVRTKAEALKLLHSLFQEKQQQLMNTFTKPLEQKITDHLKVIFGPDARAEVTYDGTEFKGFELVRPGRQKVAFTALSGGTREQVAAAVRLAIAEVLAASHGGCLPVIFDDAFVNSDPARVKSLQSMLDQAAGNGLQIIALTCNPADYTGLGATNIAF